MGVFVDKSRNNHFAHHLTLQQLPALCHSGILDDVFGNIRSTSLPVQGGSDATVNTPPQPAPDGEVYIVLVASLLPPADPGLVGVGFLAAFEIDRPARRDAVLWMHKEQRLRWSVVAGA